MSSATPHNVSTPDEQSSSGISGPREEFLTVEHAGKPEHTPDVEGVLLQVDEQSATFMLEDGERFVFDLTELRSALRAA